MTAGTPDPTRVAREERGRWAEHVAAVFLILRGHRILARRHRTPYGEIDIVARRGKHIVFVEVKHRRTREEAEAALRSQQARRVAQAAAHWIKQRPQYVDFVQCFDAVFVMPRAWPILVRDAYKPVGTSGKMW